MKKNESIASPKKENKKRRTKLYNVHVALYNLYEGSVVQLFQHSKASSENRNININILTSWFSFNCLIFILFIFLFIHYLKRTAHLAAVAILPCDPLKHIYIYTNTKHIKQLKGHKTNALLTIQMLKI